MRRLFTVLAIGQLTVFGCSDTGFLSTWVNPDFSKPALSHVLVIGVSEQESGRRFWEGAFAEELDNQGVMAEESFLLIPSRGALTKEAVIAVVREKKLDGVLVTRLLAVTQGRDESPASAATVVPHVPQHGEPYYGGWYDYYTRAHALSTEPGETVAEVVVTLETNLYDAKTGTLVWSGQTQTFRPSHAADVIGPTTQLVAMELATKKLITARN